MSLVVVGAVLYAVFRGREHGEHKGGGKDAYFYIVCFLALMPLFWGVADLGRVILEDKWDTRTYYSYSSRSAEDDLRRVSMRMSAIVVALPLFAFHWHKASSRKKEETDWDSRKTYTMGVLIVSTLLVLVVGIWLVYHGFNAVLGVATQDVKAQMAYALPYAATAAGVWLWHIRLWQGKEKTGEIAEAPKPLERGA